jgi:hypothetical protein
MLHERDWACEPTDGNDGAEQTASAASQPGPGPVNRQTGPICHKQILETVLAWDNGAMYIRLSMSAYREEEGVGIDGSHERDGG